MGIDRIAEGPSCPACGSDNMEWFVSGDGLCEDCAASWVLVNGFTNSAGDRAIECPNCKEGV